MFADLEAWYLDDYRERKRRSMRDAIRIMRTLGRTFSGDGVIDITTARMSAYRKARLQEGVTHTTLTGNWQPSAAPSASPLSSTRR